MRILLIITLLLFSSCNETPHTFDSVKDDIDLPPILWRNLSDFELIIQEDLPDPVWLSAQQLRGLELIEVIPVAFGRFAIYFRKVSFDQPAKTYSIQSSYEPPTTEQLDNWKADSLEVVCMSYYRPYFHIFLAQ